MTRGVGCTGEALLAFAEDAEKNPTYMGAYKETQPVTEFNNEERYEKRSIYLCVQQGCEERCICRRSRTACDRVIHLLPTTIHVTE